MQCAPPAGPARDRRYPGASRHFTVWTARPRYPSPMTGPDPTAPPIARVRLRDDATVPALGLGTWHMGEDAARATVEAAILAQGFDAGMTLVDTAEMYGDGGSEEVVGRAMAGRRREDLFIVSKVYPHNAGARSAAAACEASLRRLGT